MTIMMIILVLIIIVILITTIMCYLANGEIKRKIKDTLQAVVN